MGTPELLNLASLAALKAGAAIMEVYRQDDFKAKLKSDDSPVTEADLSSDAIISASLARSGLPVLSEEGADIPFGEREKWELFWLVDPLDGTKEFVEHCEGFTVNIALVDRQTPVAGVIYDPVNDVLYAGAVGHGAFKYPGASGVTAFNVRQNDEPDNCEDAGIQLPSDVTGSYGITGSRSFMDERTSRFIEEFREMYPGTRVIIGGSSLKFCRIAEGSADIYPRFSNINEWDTAAGHAILSAAGGSVVQAADISRPLVYNKQSPCNPWFIAFRDPGLLKSVTALIPQ
jgi:3'(2'), 5'-bisphosphate nucleotidase